MDSPKEIEYVECDCSDPSHAIVYSLYDWDGWHELSMVVYLKYHENFFKRVWTTLKYLFGKKDRYGWFCDTLIRIEDVDRIIGILQKFKEGNK